MRYLINNVADMKAAIKDLIQQPRLAHDTETEGPENQPDISGLYPFHGSRSFSHIFATATDEFYFNFNKGGIDPKRKGDLQEIFEDPLRLYFYVNAIFDNTIMHFDGLKNKGRIVDCPSIARVEYNEHGNQPWMDESYLSLDYLAKYYEVTLKDDRVKKYIQENNLYSPARCRFTGEKIPLFNKVPLDLMFEYGCGDGRSTFDVGTKIIQCINYKDELYANERKFPGKLIDVAQNEIKLTSVLVDMKISGIEVDKAYVHKAIAHEENVLKTLTSEVKALTCDINLNSGKQLAEFLIKQNIPVPRKEPTATMLIRANEWAKRANIALAAGQEKQYLQAKEKAEEYAKGNYQTDKKTLEKILAKYPHLDFLAKITSAKEADKKINTYYKNFLLMADENGFIHCGLNQEKAKTGRFSSTDPNLQNLHKEEGDEEYKIRTAFINSDPMFDLFFFDYDQQEMIVMLDQANEEEIIAKLMSGEFEDFYIATAAVLKEVLGREISRRIAKALALGLAYGQGKELLARNLGLTVDEAMMFKAEFFKALPRIAELSEKLKKQVEWYGKIHNPFGRVSYINKHDSYKALNSFIQGTSADITKTAMVKIYFELLMKFNLKSKLLLCVHDELIFKIHKEERWIVPEIRRLMSEAYPHKNIALTTGVEYSNCWGAKEEYAA